MEIKLRPYQFDFFYSKARYPAFVGGWAVGKTLIAIARALIYTKNIPENLGVIFRKTSRSLQDSTLKDFERYSGYKVNSNRNYVHPNNSTIMFRHIDELDSINQQNINLGWFYIEQGEELDSDKEFFMLFGRLRREVNPNDEFLKLGWALRSGWVIANAGDHWMKPLWKDGMLEGSELIEAQTFDNAENLPADFLDSLKTLEQTKPEIYKQYVLNDWNISADQFVLIPGVLIEDLKGIHHYPKDVRRIIACDPSMGGDECVIYFIENAEIKDTLILHERDTMKIVGELNLFGRRKNTDNYVIDVIGIGQGIYDRLREMGAHVRGINSAESASDPDRFYNLRTEIWWYLFCQIQDKKIPYPVDTELKKQISAPRYKVINSNGKIQLEPKDKTKERLGRSPDRADAFVYGIWGLQYVQPSNKKDAWAEDDEYSEVGARVGNAMTA